MSFVLAPEAVRDLETAVEYLAERDPAAAASLVRRAFVLFRRIDAREFDGPHHTLTDGSSVQSWPLAPFRVYYQRRGHELVILRVYHKRRRPVSAL